MKIESNKCKQVIICSVKKNIGKVILLLLLCFIGALLPSVTPLVYQRIVDSLIPNGNFKLLYVYVAILIAIPVLTSLMLNIRNVIAFQLSEAITHTLRITLFEKIAKMEYKFFLKFGVKSLVYRLTRGCGQIGDVFLHNTVLSLINSSFSLILVFVPMLLLEYRLALMALVAFPVVYFLLGRVKQHVALRDKRLYQVLMRGEGMFYEALEGLRIMRLSGGIERQKEKINDWLDEHLEVKQASVNAHEFERVSLPELCLQILYGLIFILGAMLVMSGEMTIGELVAFVAYIPRSLSSIKELLLIQVNFKSVEPYFQSINEIFDAANESSGLLQSKDVKGHIAFQNVSFTYPGKENRALSNLNFEIRPCEMVAIVGETGGGKSTIFDLLLRFYEPSSGEILLDEVPICEYDIDVYRSHYATVQQSNFLWSDTLLNNVIFPDESSCRDVYLEAIRDAQLTEFVCQLPQKDNTLLGEGGQNVSGGERQRIGLAHAFYQNRKIMLLDEPTSALDAETESKIRNVLLSYKGKKTIVVVTHRLSSILQYDRVIVIKKGEIVENDAPKTLLAQKSVLRSLCEQQGILC